MCNISLSTTSSIKETNAKFNSIIYYYIFCSVGCDIQILCNQLYIFVITYIYKIYIIYIYIFRVNDLILGYFSFVVFKVFDEWIGFMIADPKTGEIWLSSNSS